MELPTELRQPQSRRWPRSRRHRPRLSYTYSGTTYGLRFTFTTALNCGWSGDTNRSSWEFRTTHRNPGPSENDSRRGTAACDASAIDTELAVTEIVHEYANNIGLGVNMGSRRQARENQEYTNQKPHTSHSGHDQRAVKHGAGTASPRWTTAPMTPSGACDGAPMSGGCFAGTDG